MPIVGRLKYLGMVALGLLAAGAATHSPAAELGPQDAAPTLPGVAERMEQFVQGREIAGAVTLVATGDEILHLSAAGLADVDRATPMQPDSIFWIASMTKPITATAIMMLQDEGKLSVDDPVAKHLPEFAQLTMADGTPVEVTIKHLLTHTSDLAEISAEQAQRATTLAEVIPLYVSQPVRFEPGTKWAYCQSGINTAARIVEVVSGHSFVDFLDERLFAPLGMHDTTFYLTEEQVPRLATSYRRTVAQAASLPNRSESVGQASSLPAQSDSAADAELTPAEIFILHGKEPTSRDRFPAANGGLFSTAPDYARFCQMILRGGEYAGTQFLSPEAVRQMTTLKTDELQTGFTPGNGWGLGWCVIREPQGVTAALSPGSFGHGGAYGTQAWIDPVRERIYILMVQRANFPNSDASDVRRIFHEAASAQ